LTDKILAQRDRIEGERKHVLSSRGFQGPKMFLIQK
jgi:hypothetical protein